jgi:hypothetical protein
MPLSRLCMTRGHGGEEVCFLIRYENTEIAVCQISVFGQEKCHSPKRLCNIECGALSLSFRGSPLPIAMNAHNIAEDALCTRETSTVLSWANVANVPAASHHDSGQV